MGRKPKQMIMKDIDKTPLAEALTRSAEREQEIIDLMDKVEDIHKKGEKDIKFITDEMRRMDRNAIEHNGVHFKLERKAAREETFGLKINPVKRKDDN